MKKSLLIVKNAGRDGKLSAYQDYIPVYLRSTLKIKGNIFLITTLQPTQTLSIQEEKECHILSFHLFTYLPLHPGSSVIVG